MGCNESNLIPSNLELQGLCYICVPNLMAKSWTPLPQWSINIRQTHFCYTFTQFNAASGKRFMESFVTYCKQGGNRRRILNIRFYFPVLLSAPFPLLSLCFIFQNRGALSAKPQIVAAQWDTCLNFNNEMPCKTAIKTEQFAELRHARLQKQYWPFNMHCLYFTNTWSFFGFACRYNSSAKASRSTQRL